MRVRFTIRNSETGETIRVQESTTTVENFPGLTRVTYDNPVTVLNGQSLDIEHLEETP